MSRAGIVALALAGAVLSLAPTRAEAGIRPASSGVEIARLVIASPVRAQPTSRSTLLGWLAAVRPLTRQQTALPVLRRADDERGDGWLLVRLPGRPAGRVGWIAAATARVERSPWRVVVTRSLRQVSVYRGRLLFKRFPVVVGAPATPTPVGHFFVVEHVRQIPGSVLGPWAIATSAFSHVLQEFDGGPGQIALHGRDGVLARDPLGTARSHGCVRFDDDVIRLLARLLPNGTPVDVD
jgi:lipoprotein-anchoring transpeptidase ErfK/SrfK